MVVDKGNDSNGDITPGRNRRFLPAAYRLAIPLLAALAGVWWGCSKGDNPASPEPPPSLYQSLGGQKGMGDISASFFHRLRTDPDIGARFATTDSAAFTQSFAQYLCANTGGPCTYLGKSMTAAHAGMNITTADFNAFVTDFLNGMNDVGVNDSLQRVAMLVLLPVRDSVVNK